VDILFCPSGGYSPYSVADILEMDVEVSKLPEFAVESGPLFLAWAVFLCLVLSLPGNNANVVTVISDLILFMPLQNADTMSYYFMLPGN
jgi:nuclear pore complex protein Nup188